MAEEEVFEINDYSTASEWERFIADLEEALTQWSLNATNFDDTIPHLEIKSHNPKASSNLLTDPKRWTQKQEQLKFGKVCFVLTLRSFHGQNAKPQNDKIDEPRPISAPLSATSTSSTSSSKSREGSGLSQAWSDMNNLEHDWTASGHPLVRYYGLTQFLTLSCTKTDLIDTEDRIKHLLGSAAIALKNMSCEVPFFVQICQQHRRLFSGIHILNSGFRTHFDMIQFPEVPSSFQYLSELITLYKKKLNSSFSYSSAQRDRNSPSSSSPTHHSPFESKDSALEKSGTKIQISIRFTYLLSSWPPQYLIFNGNGPAHPALEEFSYLRSSVQAPTMSPCAIQTVLYKFLDPLDQFQLATTWPSVAEELIVDNAYHSDLQPRNAPRWSLRALFHEHQNQTNIKLCWVSQWFRNFLGLKIRYHNTMLAQFVGQQRSSSDAFSPDSETDFRSAFDRLSSPAERALASTTENFEDWLKSDTKSSTNLRSKTAFNIQESIRQAFRQSLASITDYSEEDKEYRDLKASPIGALSWKIAVLLANSFSDGSSVITLASVWKLVVEQLREFWEKGELLPAVDDGSSDAIDYGQCLFHQKLQMLNSCIAQKIKREHGTSKSTVTVIDQQRSELEHKSMDEAITSQSAEQKTQDAAANDDDEDDEFYDCESDEINDGESRAEGQLAELKDHCGKVQYRLDQPDKPILVPLTQDPAPMTEDQHQQHVQIIGSLTNSPEDTKLKIRMQSAGLLSDMEAFKAANPGVSFEDFIRWHSPRDWVELETDDDNKSKKKVKPEVKFGLSRRMKESTLWSDIWAIARALPISRQTRLFNYTKEAEEILHSFEAISVERLVGLMAPILAKVMIRKLRQFRTEIRTYVENNVDNKADIPQSFLEFDLKQFEVLFNRSDYENLIEECSIFEFQVSKYMSLLKKFIFAYESEAKKPFKDLLQNKPSIDNGPKPARIGTGRKIVSKSAGSTYDKSELILFAIKLLLEPDVEFASSNSIASLIVRLFAEGNRFEYENRTAVGERLPAAAADDDDDYQSQDQSNEKARQQQQQQRLFTIPQLPSPNGKEFILRAPSIARPAPYSRPSSQRLYAFLLPGKDFRIASAFTEDALYF